MADTGQRGESPRPRQRPCPGGRQVVAACQTVEHEVDDGPGSATAIARWPAWRWPSLPWTVAWYGAARRVSGRCLPPFPYGAVYFRKSDPPREDWQRDYQTAREAGMNVFRHWFMWSAIEVAPGEYDWEDYDTHLDLAAANGMKAVIAEFVSAAPEWAFAEYAHARFIDEQGLPDQSRLSPSSNTGGFPGLCLDDDDWRQRAETFLRVLAGRYRGHPGLGGYDIWNECNANPNFCYCPGSLSHFQSWLRARYGDLQALGRAWGRHSFARWEHVAPPRSHGPNPESLDWIQFRGDRAHELMRGRADVIRSVDPDCAITAHGLATTFSSMPANAADDWRAAAEVDSYGVTWGSPRHGDEPWKQMQAFDLIRASSRGKPFWHAEAYGGPLWLARQVVDRPRDEGRIPLAGRHPLLESRQLHGRRHRHAVPALAPTAERRVSTTRSLWRSEATCEGRAITLTAPARDVAVLELVP